MKYLPCACALLLTLLCSASVAQVAPRHQLSKPTLPAGYWSSEQSRAVLDKTDQSTRLAADLSHLSEGERKTVRTLLEAGEIIQKLYEHQRHAQASTAHLGLQSLDKQLGSPAETQRLLKLYRLFQGPIATTLENKREPFLPVEMPPPGANVYPWGIIREEVDDFLAKHPEKIDAILDLRTVVRRSTTENLQRDLAKLQQYPILGTFHLGLARELRQLLSKPDPTFLYAVPYSVAYADELMRVYALLNEAAATIRKDDEEFARYLRNRARDLLSNDYESGDAAWVTGRFKRLNAQIGSYEVYDDALFGVKSFFGMSVLSVREDESEDSRRALRMLQEMENSLPYKSHKRVREDLPIQTCDVIADFGQARGGNTATILPNETYIARRYGRVILLRPTIMWNSQIFANTLQGWEAVAGPSHKDELTSEGNYYRTLWHEIGHYLGVEYTKDRGDLDTALQENSALLEEMKCDLITLYVAEALHKHGYYDAERLRSVYASGINRVLQNNRPRREQPYNTMQLMQWNFFLENGLLSFDPQTGKLNIHYDKYHSVVGKLLEKVLEVQYQGDRDAADRFINQYAKWDENLHGVVARNIRDKQRYRFRLFKYAALGD